MEKPEVYSIMKVHLTDRLAELYKTDCVAVGKVCDEVLDRSGALLGEVRTRHMKLRSLQTQPTTTAACNGEEWY
jgi:hypothetical protein